MDAAASQKQYDGRFNGEVIKACIAIAILIFAAHYFYTMSASSLAFALLAATLLVLLGVAFSHLSNVMRDYKHAVLEGLARSAILLILYYLSGITVQLFEDAFLLASVVCAALSFAPLFLRDAKGNEREDVHYVIDSSNRFVAVAWAIGLLAPLLGLVNGYWGILVLIVSVSAVAAYIGIRMYMLGADYISGVQVEMYEKHKHEIKVSPDPEFSFLNDSIEAFIKRGATQNLIIALTIMLASVGAGYDVCTATLAPLMEYNAPTVRSFAGVSLKPWMETAVQNRVVIANDILKRTNHTIKSLSDGGGGQR